MFELSSITNGMDSNISESLRHGVQACIVRVLICLV